jgi:hypothetical protein
MYGLYLDDTREQAPDYRHDVCQVQKTITVVLGLKSQVVTNG